MTSELVGHQAQRQWFANAIAKGRFSGTFLLVGPPGIGKATLARTVAAAIFCQRKTDGPLAACGRCESCAQVAAGTHPDLIQVKKPEDRAYIPLELLIGPPEARLQEGFCRDIRLRPFTGTRKVGILHDADFLNDEGANSLLKTLEEPPPDAVLFLIGTNEQRQLPTIRSRCRIIRLMPPSGEEAVKLMSLRGIESDAATIDQAVDLCGGDFEAAASLLSGEANEFREELTRQLTSHVTPAIELAKMVSAYVDEAGKEAPQRRDRLRDVLAIATATFREQLLRGPEQQTLVPSIVYRIDRTIDAMTQVQRNANQATLIESWSIDIARGREV